MSGVGVPIRNYFLSRRLARGRLAFPMHLRYRRVYIFPTRQGFVFFGLLLTILFESINHNNNLGFLLTFLLGGMAFVSILHTYRNISGLVLLSARATPVFTGQPAHFEISLRASGRDRRGLSFSFGDGERITIDLEADSRTVVAVPHPTVRRGRLLPDQLYVATTYPLGLFRGWSVLFVDASCLVYPKPIAGPMVTTRGTDGEDSRGESGGEGVDDFAGLAAYQLGDPLQHISWKSFSRGQGLHTKKFEGQLAKTIYFDPDALGGDLEFRLSRTCHMILMAESMFMVYGLKVGSKIIEPGQGGSHRRLCLRTLALAGR